MSKACVECGKESWMVTDVSDKLAIKNHEYHLCVSCVTSSRRWSCAACSGTHLGKLETGLFGQSPPLCPTCGKVSKGKVSAVLIPEQYKGKSSAANLWRSSKDDAAMEHLRADEAATKALAIANAPKVSEAEARFTAETQSMRLYKAEYLGGHPDAARGEVVILGCHDAGVRVYSRTTYAALFDMPWATIARVQHVHVPKDKPITQGEMYMATYGSTGRGGAVTDWANAAIAIRGLFGRDKHIVSIVLRTADGFEGAVGFEDKDGERIAKGLTSERLRHGGSATPPAQSAAAAPPGSDVIAKLKELAALKEAGVLTDAEFTAKKAELLARL